VTKISQGVNAMMDTLLNLSLLNWKEISQTTQAFTTSLAYLFAAAWTYFIFIKRREGHPRLEFDVGIETLAVHNQKILMEVICKVTNKGFVRQKIFKLSSNVRYLSKSDPLIEGDDTILRQTKFPHHIGERSFFPVEEWEWSFIEAGISQRYSYIVHIPPDSINSAPDPADISLILVWAKLTFGKKADEDFYTAQRVYQLQDGQWVGKTIKQGGNFSPS
jgi:hypothetical protein